MNRFRLTFLRLFCRASLLTFFLLLTACGASKPIPDWLRNSNNLLESYKKSYLSGDEKIAVLKFKGAVSEIKKSGDMEMLAKAHLIRMALQTALLEEIDDGEYLKINDLSPTPQNQAFYAFLKGQADQVDEKVLPPQYQVIFRDIRQGATADYLQGIGKIEDPLSRLIATGVLMRTHNIDEGILQKAIDTASAQGWKKALLVYLERLNLYYLGKQEKEKSLAIEQRIKLIRD